MAEERKSKPGPMESFRSCKNGTDSTAKLSRPRTNSNTAKFTAPWGMDKMKLAPAPLVRRRNICGWNKSPRVGRLGPRDDCRIVFMVLAGCMTVCAILRETAPLTMFSQKTRGRVMATAAAAAVAAALPPRGVADDVLDFAATLDDSIAAVVDC